MIILFRQMRSFSNYPWYPKIRV